MNSRRVAMLLIGLGILSLLVFLGFTKVVSKELLGSWDFDLTVKLQNRLPERFDDEWLFFSWLARFDVLTVILGIWTILYRRWEGGLVWAGYGLGMVVIYVLKQILWHPAPTFMFYRGVGEFEFSDYYVHTDYSYPSGHAFRMAFVGVVLGRYLYDLLPRRLWYVAVLGFVGLLICVSITKVVLGHHWTSDVVAGVSLGIGSGLLGVGLMDWVGTLNLSLAKNKKVSNNESKTISGNDID